MNYWIGWAADSWGASWGHGAGEPPIEVDKKVKWDDVGGGPGRSKQIPSIDDDWDWHLGLPKQVSRDDQDTFEIMQMVAISGVLGWQAPCLRGKF